MSSPRERLRQAAADLAESFYDLLRQDLIAGAIPGPAARSPGSHVGAPSPSSTAAPADNVQVLTDWIRRHPGANPTAMMKGLRWSSSKLFELLKAALTSGRVRKEGAGRAVRYVVSGATLDAPSRTPSPTGVVAELRDRVVEYIAQHPGAAPRDLVAAMSASRSSVFRALLAACEAGDLEKVGSPPVVRYMLPGAELPSTQPGTLPPGAVRPGRRTAAPPPSDEALIAQVTAFVVAHPECRFRDIQQTIPQTEAKLNNALKEARARGLIRLEGVKIKSRYFPVTIDATPKGAVPPLHRETPPERAKAASVPPPAPRPVERVERVERSERVERRPAYDRAEAMPPEVEQILNEIEIALADDMHDIRLGALLQAVVADIRVLQPRFPDDHPARKRLDGAIRRITAIRAERDLPFINGLRRDASANWAMVARDARRRIASFDADSELSTPTSRTHKAPKQKAPASTREEGGEPLPRLIAMSEEKPIVLVGGIKKNEVLEQVRARHGLDVEWAAMQGTNARAAEHLLEKIRHGRVGAVVILEGLTGTTQIRSVVDACKTASVPFAYGGRAGTESLRSALTELEAGPAPERVAQGR